MLAKYADAIYVVGDLRKDTISFINNIVHDRGCEMWQWYSIGCNKKQDVINTATNTLTAIATDMHKDTAIKNNTNAEPALTRRCPLCTGSFN